MRATIPSHTLIPAGSVIRTRIDVNNFRTINIKEEEYQKNVFASASALREGYEALYGNGPLEKAAGQSSHAVSKRDGD